MTRLHARLLLCLALPLLAWPARGISEPSSRREKNAELGTEVELPCALELPKCNGLHSIKWYRGPKRIFVFSEGAGVTRGNSSVAARADMIYVANTNVTFLKIPNVQLEDEGLYKCEPTYLAVNRECNNVQHISLNVTVQPSFVRVTDEETNAILSSGTTLGPINEGTEISLNCESGEGKPVPVVEWYSGNRSLEATSRLEINDNGIGTGSSRLEMQITRDELGATFTCRVGSPALREPLTIDIHLDVNVRPSKMNLTGFAGHAVQETNILLQCVVNGARPAANVTWYNGTTPLGEDRTRFKMFETEITNESDGTYKTDSRLAFTAKEFDNGKTFSCHAENTVTREEGIKPMKVAQAIEVWYVPIVRMKPDNITVNETDNFLMFCDYEANPATLNSVKWLLDGEELTLNKEHYEGGITEQTALMVKNATQADMGTYTCILSNDIGESKTDDYVDVSVLYKPVVEVTMEPEAPVNEADHLNVSLVCNLLDGNPPTLTAVRWYLDGDLLKELPDCPRNATPPTPEETSTYCDIDPSKLLLEAVGRSFHGNYSCVGRNDAGWGFVSANTSVVVHYKPGPASISYEPKQVIKKGPLNITCSVEDPGRPKATGYKWFRGLHRLPDENNALLRIESVNLEEEANFTCMAYNEAGDGDPVTTFIDVSAAPAFIKKLSTYQGYVYNAPNVSIECWVECAPICNITWLKDNVPINFARTDKYYVSNVFHPPSPSSNDFESVQSTLIWNLTARPGGQLDRFSDSVLFTCESTSNGIGPGVKSSTHFHVEFPPENMTISEKVINVVVDHIPKNVLCGAKAHPEPTFRWYREDSTETILEGRILTFKTSIPRRSAGTYFCEASNRHGNRTISTYMNVQYKPECRIDRDRVDGQDYVVCSAIANPKESGFSWSLKNDNDTLEQVSEDRNEKSYLPLDGSVSNFRTYICVANNSIGFSSPCERTVPGNVPWWSRLLGDLLIVVIVAAVIILVVIIVVCIVIFLLCRRKRNQVKYPNPAANNNHVDSISEGLPEPETKTFYENLPFHGIQTPPNKTNSQHKYQEHYRQRQQQEHQGGYAIPSNSSGQLTSLTRGTHHPSSVVGPLQTSLAHTNNRHSLPHRDASLPGQHGAGEPEPGHDRMPTRQGSGHEESGAGTTGTVGSRRGERRKPRKHEPADRKQKQRRPDARRHAPDQGYATSRETSFHRNQELGIPESGKIAYPHYYEDAITLDHPQKPRNPHQLDRGVHYADLNLPKGRTKGKRYTQSHRDVRTPGGVPNSTQYAELRFRDVGKEIDV
ncbi:hemicentin-1 isoform X2 [Orussus abietinus]|uniref:hemicentin-1 isoform X2 n=1 Tax=Orussus abietinus TaxID=222816 RepID=UPI0006266D50|nr:hemicentin-1 isoform X2 [Orussus abietinus]